MRNGPGRFDRKTSQWKKEILQGPFYRMPVLCFAAGDYAALLAAEWTALIIRGYFSSYPVFSADPVYFYILIPASFLIFLSYGGLYGRQKALWQMAERLFHACLYGIGLSVILLFISHEAGSTSRLFIGFLGLFSFPFLFISRCIMRRFLRHMRWLRVPVLIIGAGLSADALVREMRNGSGMGYEVIGFLEDYQPAAKFAEKYPILGGFDDLEEVVRETGVRTAFIAAPGLPQKKLTDLVCRAQMILDDVGIVPNLVSVPMSHAAVETFFDDRIMVLHIQNDLFQRMHRIEKRIFDLVLASLGILVSLPVWLAAALWIRTDSQGPVFFAQERIGQYGRIFPCYKFRTMFVHADEKLQSLLERDPDAQKEWESSFKLKEDPRITKAGRFLRRTSLDELPQLWNVIRGDMSLVGPRPIVHEEIEKYGPYFKEYDQVRPGITGLWQVSGRSNVDYGERVRMDSWYVHNWSVWIDMMLLWRTIKAVMEQKGAY
jgi:undecaprenyl-phosphate galactose phosphotransferase